MVPWCVPTASEPTWLPAAQRSLFVVAGVSAFGCLLTGLMLSAAPLVRVGDAYTGMALLGLHGLAVWLTAWGVWVGSVLQALAPWRPSTAEWFVGATVLPLVGGAAFVASAIASVQGDVPPLAWALPQLIATVGALLAAGATCVGTLRARSRGGVGFTVGLVVGGSLLAWSLPSSLLATLLTLEALAGHQRLVGGPGLDAPLWLGAGVLLAAQARGEGDASVVDRWGFLVFLPAAIALLLPFDVEIGPAATAAASMALAVGWMATSSGGWIGRGLVLGVGLVWLGVELLWPGLRAVAGIHLHDTFAEVAVVHLQWPFVLAAVLVVRAVRDLRGPRAAALVWLFVGAGGLAMARMTITMWALGVAGLPRRYGGMAYGELEGAVAALLPAGLALLVITSLGTLAWWRSR